MNPNPNKLIKKEIEWDTSSLEKIALINTNQIIIYT